MNQYRKTLMITDVTDNTVKKIGDIKKNQGEWFIYDLAYKYLFISGIDIHISDDNEDGNGKDEHGSGKSIINDQSPETKVPPPGITSFTLL